MARPYGARKRALLTIERLKQIYPAQCELDFRNPFELLVATILSAQSTDKTVNRVTPKLFERWPGPRELAEADPAVHAGRLTIEIMTWYCPAGTMRLPGRTVSLP